MKKLAAALIFTLIFIFPPVSAQTLTHIDGEDLYNRTADEIQSGSFSLNPSRIVSDGLDMLLGEIRQSRTEIINLFIIAALSSIIQILKSEGGGGGIGENAFFACFTLMTISALKIFSVTVGCGITVTDSICEFVTKLSPLLAALIVSGGGTASAAAFHPILSAAVYTTTLLIDKCIVPMIYFSAILGIVGHISPRLKISSMTALLRSLTKWLLTASLTVFTGVSAIYGFSAPAFDAVAMKGIKFAVGSFVPVVGGLLSETVETVIGGTRLMKSAVGTAGIVSLVALSAIPVIKITAVYLILRVAAAASEPIADKRISDMLGEIASSVSLVLAMVITSAILFIICISVILGAT